MMIQNKQYVKHHKVGDIDIVTVDRPPVNALSEIIDQELKQTFVELCEQNLYGVIILTGAGNTFMAGADITRFPSLDSDGGASLARIAKEGLDYIENSSKVVIAAINGVALGGGCEWALACDIRVIDESTIIGLPEVSIGVLPGVGGTQRLARQVGVGKAKELIFTGDPVEANEAYRIGLVERVAAKGEAVSESIKLAERILKRGPIAVAKSKESINNSVSMTADEGFKAETRLFGELFDTADQKEGAAAFFEKRKPVFKGV